MRDSLRTATIALILLVVPAVVLSQSGRRSSKPASSPPPATVSAPVELTKPPANPAATVKAKVLIARQSSKKRLASEDAIYAAAMKHLNQFADFSATVIGDLKTDQAAKRAQQEQETYVAVVQFEVDVYQNGHLVLNSQNLQINSHIYAPKTGERKFKEKTYYQPMGGMGSRTSGSPVGVPVKITTEAAGISVAEQIRNGVILAIREQTPALRLP
ncbi:MAG: hypothetical protein AABM67_21820 [Acidobacteriota bacterium]